MLNEGKQAKRTDTWAQVPTPSGYTTEQVSSSLPALVFTPVNSE